MTSRLVITLAQLNFTLGDIEGNLAKIETAYKQAASGGSDLILFPEMAITGYPPEDLVLRPSFQQEAMQAVYTLALSTGKTAMLAGGLWCESGKLYNALFLLGDGKILHQQYKHALPNYGVFDEKRVFASGALPSVFSWRDHTLGLLICEDMWDAETSDHLVAQAPDLLIVVNASPYEMGKAKRRYDVAQGIARKAKAPVVYVNLIGGQDELVFDGRSFVISHTGDYAARLTPFEEGVATVQLENGLCINGVMNAPQGDEETIYRAMMLGLRDYVDKNRFKGVILGLSGGIDSGITAAVAVDALGADRVHSVLMPSPYTSAESIDDATECASLLGIILHTVSITPAMEIMEETLAPLFKHLPKDTTEENIQARLRATILMAISNKLGLMVLTTGNKSEMSVGYATLYGDMCGGYSVLKDVYKTTVYKLSRWRNQKSPVIPERMITKAPSAELKPDQKDQDSLPPYEILDAILHGLVEERLSVDAVVARGFSRETVVKTLRMLVASEYKRRQAPPGVKLSSMSFGKDWRYPVTNRFRN